MALASSSRSQVLTQPARAGSGVTSGRSSIGVRWRPRLAVVIVTQLVTRVLGCLATAGRVSDAKGLPPAGATCHVAFHWMSSVVGELDLAVLRPAVFSKALSERRFLFLTLLASSRGFRCSCALHVPLGGHPLTSCRRVSAVLTCDNVQLR
jgi:hypothetical protein